MKKLAIAAILSLAAAFPSHAATVSKTFSAHSIASDVLYLQRGESLTVSVSGSFVATIRLERSVDGVNFATVGQPFTAPASATILNETGSAARYRLFASTHTSGSAVTSLSDASDIVQQFFNRRGDAVFTIRDDGSVSISTISWVDGSKSTTAASGGGGASGPCASSNTTSVVCLGSSNAINGGATNSVISGGSANALNGNFNALSGGDSNQMTGGGYWNFMGGGSGNAISSSGNYNVLGGGINNTISGIQAGITIAGGSGNTASGNISTVGGGTNNNNSGHSGTIGGGNGNVNTAQYATVSGGRTNSNDNEYGVIAGGHSNVNTLGAFGAGSVIGGGESNTISNYVNTQGVVIAGGSSNGSGGMGAWSVISGGNQNKAQGAYSVTPGGLLNSAFGDYSYAAGRRAKATAQGSFVLADSTDANLTASTTDQLLIRFAGGVQVDAATTITVSTWTASYVGGSAYVCVNDSGVLFVSEVACP